PTAAVSIVQGAPITVTALGKLPLNAVPPPPATESGMDRFWTAEVQVEKRQSFTPPRSGITPPKPPFGCAANVPAAPPSVPTTPLMGAPCGSVTGSANAAGPNAVPGIRSVAVGPTPFAIATPLPETLTWTCPGTAPPCPGPSSSVSTPENGTFA